MNGRNIIIDAIPYNSDTFDKYLVYCPDSSRPRHFENNSWGLDILGNSIMPPVERFRPSCFEPENDDPGYFIEPLWSPGDYNLISLSNDEVIYHLAVDRALSEDIEGAITLFMQIIDEYPESEYTPAAAKNLLALETDKEALKYFYQTEPNLYWNGEIGKLADYLVYCCNVSLGDYQEAIAWLEDVISNPCTEYDSLMAVIDLGFVYLLMQENESKAAITSMYPQYIPISKAEYEQNREHLLSMMFDPAESNNHEDTNSPISTVVELNRNYPNPFNPSTAIAFSIPKDMQCNLEIYNLKGQRVKTLINGNQTKGNHKIIWNGNDDNGKSVSSGVYFYKLTTPERVITNKMIMLK